MSPDAETRPYAIKRKGLLPFVHILLRQFFDEVVQARLVQVAGTVQRHGAAFQAKEAS